MNTINREMAELCSQLDLTTEQLSTAEMQLIEQNADSKTQMRRLRRYKETTVSTRWPVRVCRVLTRST